MTPYTKKIVELHKIHKAIEEKDCCNDGGGTKEITIDDVVKFIHDNTEDSSYDIPTKYNDIKRISEPLTNGFNLVRGTSEEVWQFIDSITDSHIEYRFSILESTNYAIAVIYKDTPA